MESLRRPSVLAALAAALLVISVVVLVARGGSDPADEDVVADPGAEDTEAGTDAGPDQDGTDDGDGANDDGDGQAPQDGSDGDGAAAGQQDGGEETGEDGRAADDGEGPADEPALGVPVAGEYGYASGGSWSLSGGGQSEEHQLPATATATVQVEGDAWHVRLAAGERYADQFGYSLGPDGGLDWVSWVLERQFDNTGGETSYSCSGDAAYYRPDEPERVVSHACESDAGITSDGTVEHLGTEEVTLGDGSVVAADRLLYTYTVTGSGSNFEVTGEGRLDLWLDPATGQRMREQRSISTTTTFENGREQVYQEDVEFTLQSQQPS